MPRALHHESIRELSQRIRSGAVSPVEVVGAFLARIAALQPKLNAFITVMGDVALKQAEVAAKEIRGGNWRGPLHGIPVGVKDFYDTAGVRTTAAFEAFKRRVPAGDAVAVAALKRAGAIIIGKTNMHTLGMGTTGLVSAFGPARNPWNADFIPGGSSSGSAAAVASGMCPATLDTDAVGSTRLPAACCGAVGFKGTYGRISTEGILAGEEDPGPFIRAMSHAAVTARTVEDAAIMFDVLAVTQVAEAITEDARGIRIGIGNNVNPAQVVRTAFERAAAVFRDGGFAVSEVPVPFSGPAGGIANIEADRQTIGDRAFRDVDVILLPTLPTTVPTIEGVASNAEQGLSAEYTVFANHYGLPAISVPCGFDAGGLPLGLQLVGRPGDDQAVLRAAHWYQGSTEKSLVRDPEIRGALTKPS
jgi:aspartyl-tRNA(Asn)/glutamyl-tRNA(Gln) amidotransferase subunit A